MAENKPKLLYIVTQAEWGGAQRHIFDLAANLSQDFDITIGFGSSGCSQELIKKINQQNIKMVNFKHLVRPINPLQDLPAVMEIAQFIRKNHFDIIHLHSSKAGVIGGLAKTLNRLLGKNPQPKLIYTAHGWVYIEPCAPIKQWLYLMMEKVSARLRDATIVLSEKEKDVALKQGTAKKESVYVIPNGIDLNNLNFLSRAEARKHLGLEENQFIIGAIANLYKTKGLEYLIEALRLINKEPGTKSKAKMIIVGEGPEREKLESRIKNYELEDKIILAGSIPEACKYLPAFDIFVLPSVKEGFPYALLEAMAAGLPIIATDVGAIPEILENKKTGLIIEPANAFILATSIRNLYFSPPERQMLGINAAGAVKKFDVQKMIEKTKTVYQKLF